jgi:hypothetical protein
MVSDYEEVDIRQPVLDEDVVWKLVELNGSIDDLRSDLQKLEVHMSDHVANDLRPMLETIRQAIIVLIVVTGIGAIWIAGTLRHWF